jgi:AraC-like DNA-binding protein
VLAKYPGFETTIPELTREVMMEHFGAMAYDCKAKEAVYFTRANWASTKYLRVTSAHCSISTDITYESDTVIRQFFVADTKTNIDFEINRETHTLSIDQRSVVIPAGLRYRGLTHGPSRVMGLRFEAAALASVGTAILGERLDASDLIDEQWQSDTQFAGLHAATAQFIADLDALKTEDRFAAEVFGQALLVRFLLECKGKLRARFSKQISPPSMLQMHRVESFLAANCHHQLDVEAIALEFGMSARALLRDFQKIRGMTPLEFVKQQRLEMAHRLLQKPDEGTHVIQVAFKCGFRNSGQFQREYRRRFGVHPSVTLNRARDRDRS